MDQKGHLRTPGSMVSISWLLLRHPEGKKQGKLTLEDFDVDDDGRITSCPEGLAPARTSVARHKIEATFSKEGCRKCPLLDKCPGAPTGRKEARWQYTPDRVVLRTRRLLEQGDDFRRLYRWRAGVESNNVPHQTPDGNGQTQSSRPRQRKTSQPCSGRSD